MKNRVFKRKIYDELLKWKRESKGKTALLLQGARRVGKSTIVEEFAKKEYKSHIIIDFNKASEAVRRLFDDLMGMIDWLAGVITGSSLIGIVAIFVRKSVTSEH